MPRRYTEIIELNIEGTTLEADVIYTYEDPIPAIIHRAPENCHPAEGGELEIIDLQIMGNSVAALLDDPSLKNHIAGQLTLH